MSPVLRLALVADSFYPLRTSGAVQLRDLAREFTDQGHQLTVIYPEPELAQPFLTEHMDGFKVIRLRTASLKDINYIKRTVNEFLMPYQMLRALKKAGIALNHFDGVIWYSPSIFLTPLVSTIKRASGCKAYLIIRDIFPEWAVDMGLMGRGLPYLFFVMIAKRQYAIANTIGVQTPGNLKYFSKLLKADDKTIEVLPNWLQDAVDIPCSISLESTKLAGRRIFVYAGNMGIAQGMNILLELAKALQKRNDVGFLFVGRGSESEQLKQKASAFKLTNTLFYDEIDPDEIPQLYRQCHVGLVALDPRHKSHNIPGKFLTYMQSGLPVLANLNAGNDLADIIRATGVGKANETNDLASLVQLAEELLEEIEQPQSFADRCKALFATMFSAQNAVNTILRGL